MNNKISTYTNNELFMFREKDKLSINQSMYNRLGQIFRMKKKKQVVVVAKYVGRP